MQGEDNGIPAGETLTNTDSAPPSPREGTQSEDAADETKTQRSSQLPLVSVPSDFYAMEQEVGRGGVGVVTKAHDRRLGRSVALKRLQRPEPQARLRFEREMRITAKLQHPGVVPIHEAGVLATGEPFYAMKLVEGRSLKELIGERKSIGERLQLLPNLVAVIETVAYAHNVGVIHRDIKPSNIIVGAYGETVVIDWGLAKDLASVEDETFKAGPFRTSVSGVMTVTGQIVGTPAYMPPEQAEGADVDRRADVYALGAVLRQLLTGAAPYSGRSSQDVLKAVLAAPPKSLAEVAPDAPKDLAAIANKAMAREASNRYADAAELLTDLKSFLNGRLVSAYSYAPTERLRKWAAARRGVVVTAAIAASILIGIGAVSLAQIIKERDAAVFSRQAAVLQTNALLREQAARELDLNNPIRAFELLQAYPRDASDWDKVSLLVHRIGLAGLPDYWTHPTIPANERTRLAIDSRGTLLAVAGPTRLEVWNLITRRLVHVVAMGGAETAYVVELEAIALDNRTIWTVALDSGDLVMVAALSGVPSSRVSRHRPCGDAGISDTASAHGKSALGIACTDGRVLTMDIRSGEISPVTSHSGVATALIFMPADTLASSSDDGIIRISRSVARQPQEVAIQVGSPIYIMGGNSLCRQTLAGTADGRVLLLEDGAVTSEFTVPGRRPILAVGIDERCRLVFGWNSSRQLIVFDLVTRKPLFSGAAASAAFYPGRSAIVTGSDSGMVEYWEPLTGWKQSWRASTQRVSQLVIADEGTIGAHGDVLAAYRPGRIPQVYSTDESVRTMATAHDESLVFLGGLHGGVATLDLDHKTLTERPWTHEGIALVRAGAGKSFYSAGKRDGCILRWQEGISTGPVLCAPGGIQDIVAGPADGTLFAGTMSGTVLGYDSSKPQGYTLIALNAPLSHISFDRDGMNVVASAVPGSLFVLDGDLRLERTLTAAHTMNSAASTSSGRVIAVTNEGPILTFETGQSATTHTNSCGNDGTYRVWFSPSRDQVVAGCMNGRIAALPAISGLEKISHGAAVSDVDAADDGTVVGACSLAGTVTVLDLANRQLRAANTSVALENLEVLPTRGSLVAVAQERGLIAVWAISELSAPYPVDDTDTFNWLHPRGE